MSSNAWRLNSKYGIAYLEDKKLVEKILELEGRQSKKDSAVMATYLSPKGKPFAWQVRFSTAHWDRVSRALGMEAPKKKAVRPAKKAVRPVKKATPAASKKPASTSCSKSKTAKTRAVSSRSRSGRT